MLAPVQYNGLVRYDSWLGKKDILHTVLFLVDAQSSLLPTWPCDVYDFFKKNPENFLSWAINSFFYSDGWSCHIQIWKQ